MLELRHSNERGHFNFDWLDTFHTFSFGEYYDPDHMHFSVLRVINEDVVQAGKGFPTHPHRDMEIITYVLEGELEHKDSMGNGSTIRPGDVQYMSAGSGVRHSEFNHSAENRVHLLQIWILPDQENVPPRYAQKTFARADREGKLRLVVSPDGQDNSIAIRQDAFIFASILAKNSSVTHPLRPGRKAWIQVARGQVNVNGRDLKQGDGAALTQEKAVELRVSDSEAEFLLFDLP